MGNLELGIFALALVVVMPALCDLISAIAEDK